MSEIELEIEDWTPPEDSTVVESTEDWTPPEDSTVVDKKGVVTKTEKKDEVISEDKWFIFVLPDGTEKKVKRKDIPALQSKYPSAKFDRTETIKESKIEIYDLREEMKETIQDIDVGTDQTTQQIENITTNEELFKKQEKEKIITGTEVITQDKNAINEEEIPLNVLPVSQVLTVDDVVEKMFKGDIPFNPITGEPENITDEEFNLLQDAGWSYQEIPNDPNYVAPSGIQPTEGEAPGFKDPQEVDLDIFGRPKSGTHMEFLPPGGKEGLRTLKNFFEIKDIKGYGTFDPSFGTAAIAYGKIAGEGWGKSKYYKEAFEIENLSDEVIAVMPFRREGQGRDYQNRYGNLNFSERWSEAERLKPGITEYYKLKGDFSKNYKLITLQGQAKLLDVLYPEGFYGEQTDIVGKILLPGATSRGEDMGRIQGKLGLVGRRHALEWMSSFPDLGLGRFKDPTELNYSLQEDGEMTWLGGGKMTGGTAQEGFISQISGNKEIQKKIEEGWLLPRNADLLHKLLEYRTTQTDKERINQEVRYLMSDHKEYKINSDGIVITGDVKKGKEYSEELLMTAIDNQNHKIYLNGFNYIDPGLIEISREQESILFQIDEIIKEESKLSDLDYTMSQFLYETRDFSTGETTREYDKKYIEERLKKMKWVEETKLTREIRLDLQKEYNKLKEKYDANQAIVLKQTGTKKNLYDPFTGKWVSDEDVNNNVIEIDRIVEAEAVTNYPSTSWPRERLKTAQVFLGNKLIALAKTAYKNRNMLSEDMSVFENVGETWLDLVSDASSVKWDLKKMEAISRTNELQGHLTFLPTNNLSSIQFNQALKDFMVISRALDLNIDPRTVDPTSALGWFGSGVSNYAELNIDNVSQQAETFVNLLPTIGLKTSEKDKAIIKDMYSGWNQWSYGFGGFVGMGAEFGIVTLATRGVGITGVALKGSRFFKGGAKLVETILGKTKPFSASRGGTFMLNWASNTMIEAVNITGQGILAKKTHHGEMIPLTFAPGMALMNTLYPVLAVAFRTGKSPMFNALNKGFLPRSKGGYSDLLASVSAGLTKPTLGTGAIIAGEYTKNKYRNLVYGDSMEEFYLMTKPEQLFDTWASLALLARFNPKATFTRPLEAVRNDLLAVKGTDANAQRAAKFLDIEGRYLNKNFNQYEIDAALDNKLRENKLGRYGRFRKLNPGDADLYNSLKKAANMLHFRNNLNFFKEYNNNKNWNGEKNGEVIRRIIEKYQSGENLDARDIEGLASLQAGFLQTRLENPDLTKNTNNNINSAVVQQQQRAIRIVEMVNYLGFEVGSKKRSKIINNILTLSAFENEIEAIKTQQKKGVIPTPIAEKQIEVLNEKIKYNQKEFEDQIEKHKADQEVTRQEEKELAKKMGVAVDFQPTTESYIAAIRKAGGKITDAQGKTEGYFKTDDGQIFINEEWARKVFRVSHVSHEVLHKVTQEALDAMSPLERDVTVEKFIESLSEYERKTVYESVKDHPSYKGDSEAGIKGNRLTTEWINIFHDKVATGLIKERVSTTKKVGNWFKNLWQSKTPFENIDFKDGKAVYDFVKKSGLKWKRGEVFEPAMEMLAQKEENFFVKKYKPTSPKEKFVYKEDQSSTETLNEELAAEFSSTELKDLEIERAKLLAQIKERSGPDANVELQSIDKENVEEINKVLNTVGAKVNLLYEVNKENYKNQFKDAEGNYTIPDWASEEYYVDKRVWDVSKGKFVPVYKINKKGDFIYKADGSKIVEKVKKVGLQGLYKTKAGIIADKYSNVPGFNRHGFIEKLLGIDSRGLLDLAEKFDGRGTLNGWINTHLEARGYEILEEGQVSHQQFHTDKYGDIVAPEAAEIIRDFPPQINVTNVLKVLNYPVGERGELFDARKSQLKEEVLGFMREEGRVPFEEQTKTSKIHTEFRAFTSMKFKEIKDRMGDMRYRDKEGNIISKEKANELGIKSSYENFLRNLYPELIKFDKEIFSRAKWTDILDIGYKEGRKMSVDESASQLVKNLTAGNWKWDFKAPGIDVFVDFMLAQKEFEGGRADIRKTQLAKMTSEELYKGAIVDIYSNPNQPKLNAEGEVIYKRDSEGEIIMEPVLNYEGNFVYKNGVQELKPAIETYDVYEGLNDTERSLVEAGSLVNLIALQLNKNPEGSFAATAEKVIEFNFEYGAFKNIDPLLFTGKLEAIGKSAPILFKNYLQAVNDGKIPEFYKNFPDFKNEIETIVIASSQQRVMEKAQKPADFLNDFKEHQFFLEGKNKFDISDKELKERLGNIGNMRSTWSHKDGHPDPKGSGYGRMHVERLKKFEIMTRSIAPFMPNFLGKGLSQGLLTLDHRTNGEGMSDAKLLERVDLEGNPVNRASYMNIYDQVVGTFGTAKELKGLYDGLSEHAIKQVGVMKRAFKKSMAEGVSEVERIAIVEKAFSEIDNSTKKELYFAWGSAQQRWLNASKNKVEWLDRAEHIALIARQNTNIETGVRQLVPIEALFWPEGGLGEGEIHVKLEHGMPMAYVAGFTARSIIDGTWETQGKAFVENFSGIYGMRYEFDIVDMIGKPTNIGGTDRLALVFDQLKNYRRVEGGFKETVYDWLVRKHSQELAIQLKGLSPAFKDLFIADIFSGTEKSNINLKLSAKNTLTLRKLEEMYNSNKDILNTFSSTPEKFSNSQILNNLRLTDKANDLSKTFNNPIKKMRIFDIDNTLINTFEKVGFDVRLDKGFPVDKIKILEENGFKSSDNKIIFFHGGPAAGKSGIVAKIKSENPGFKVLNSDKYFEWLKKEEGVPESEFKMTPEQRSKTGYLMSQAIKYQKGKVEQYLGTHKGIILDGTSASSRELFKKKEIAEYLGYKPIMISLKGDLDVALKRNRMRKERSLLDKVVERTHLSAESNRSLYKETFGEDFIEINTNDLKQGEIPIEQLDRINNFTKNSIIGKFDVHQFGKLSSAIEGEGTTFDFGEFDGFSERTTEGPLFKVAKLIAEKGDPPWVLSARGEGAIVPGWKILNAMGLNIPQDKMIMLGDGSPLAKTSWMRGKVAEGYNDFYFADDVLENVEGMRTELDLYDVKYRVQHAKQKLSQTLDKDFNLILEKSKGIEWYKDVSPVRAKLIGGKKRYNLLMPPSTFHLIDFIQPTLSKGKEGDLQMGWYKERVINPFHRGQTNLDNDKLSLMSDFKGFRKKLTSIPYNLKKTAIPGFSYSNVARINVWTKSGYDMTKFGLSKTDLGRVNKFVKNNPEMDLFSDNLISINKGDGYIAPTENWIYGDITRDLIQGLETIKRPKYFEEFKQNIDIIYSPKNLNKLEYLYGTPYRESLENMLGRMLRGSNRPLNLSKGAAKGLNWLNGSVAATMYYNTKSSVLQLLSAPNFLNWTDNNPLKAGAAFVNQKQYWKDVGMIMNSPWLKQRRGGREFDLAGSELNNSFLQHGFLFTKYGDSAAIAIGGATFYRNRLKTYGGLINPLTKKLYTFEEAHSRSMLDLRKNAEKSQQSVLAMYQSAEQSGGITRFVTHFANTPIQYNKLIMQSAKDLAARRGDWKHNMSRIMYYSTLQNALFVGLQQGIFALGFDEFGEDETNKKFFDSANSMADNLLRGFGVGGSILAAAKNLGLDLYDRSQRDFPQLSKSTWKMFDAVPSLDIKVTHLNTAFNNWEYNNEAIYEKGLSLENPAWLSGAHVTEALFNIPLNRLMSKITNIGHAMEADRDLWERMALAGGWKDWQLHPKETPGGLAVTDKMKKKQFKNMYKYQQDDILESLEIPDDEIKDLNENEKVDILMEVPLETMDSIIEEKKQNWRKGKDGVEREYKYTYKDDKGKLYYGKKGEEMKRRTTLPEKEQKILKHKDEIYKLNKSDQVNYIMENGGYTKKQMREKFSTEAKRVEEYYKLKYKKD